MNRGELKLRVSRMLGIPVGTSDDEIDESQFLEQLANEAVVDILSRTRINIRSANAVMTDGYAEYDLSQKVLRVITVQRNGKTLTEQPRDRLTGNGYAFAGYGRILLGSPATSGEDLFIWYTPRPDPMTTDTDDPSADQFGDIPLVFHRALVNYMCWHAADKAGDQEAGRGEKYRMRYEGQDGMGGPGTDLGMIKSQINTMGSVATIKRRQETLVGDVNPSYWTG